MSSAKLKEQIDDWISKPPIGNLTMKITPARAKQMLEYINKQRPMSASVVTHYARQMREGRWHDTKQPIIFSRAGDLIDGQHRLGAVVESKASIKMDVAFGAGNESFAYIDIGKRRSAADIFSINGVKASANCAAATALVVKYDLKPSGTTFDGGGGYNFTPDELYQKYCDYSTLDKSLFVAYMFQKNRLAQPSVMMGLHYICARKNRADADEFFTKLGEGLFTKKDDPAYKLHAKLIRNAAADEKFTRTALVAISINAWNANRRGLTTLPLKWNTGKAFPRAI